MVILKYNTIGEHWAILYNVTAYKAFSHKRSFYLDLHRNAIKYLRKNKSSVQPLSHVQLFVTPWTSARQASQSITNSQSLLKLMSIKSVMPSNHLIFYHPLPSPPVSSPSPPTFNLSQHQGLFQGVSSSHQEAKVLGVSASASVLPMNIQH